MRPQSQHRAHGGQRRISHFARPSFRSSGRVLPLSSLSLHQHNINKPSMHRTCALQRLISTGHGQRRILKRGTPVAKYIRQAIESGTYPPAEGEPYDDEKARSKSPYGPTFGSSPLNTTFSLSFRPFQRHRAFLVDCAPSVAHPTHCPPDDWRENTCVARINKNPLLSATIMNDSWESLLPY